MRTGERVADGQVLVKRIDMRSIEPRVVLEQNGIEVELSVAGVAETAEVEAESAALPTEQAPRAQASLVSNTPPILPTSTLLTPDI